MIVKQILFTKECQPIRWSSRALFARIETRLGGNFLVSIQAAKNAALFNQRMRRSLSPSASTSVLFIVVLSAF